MKPFLILFCLLLSCYSCAFYDNPKQALKSQPLFSDESSSRLPLNLLSDNSMDALSFDIDADGDLDLLIAVEFKPNLVLINDGNGFFSPDTNGRLPAASLDSEDIALSDLNGDGFLDLLFVSEDDSLNEYYINDGKGFYIDHSSAFPVNGVSNAVEAFDVDADGDNDIIIGNNGQNELLLNQGDGRFEVVTKTHLPAKEDITQDTQHGDLNGDGFPDLVIANEGANRILLNNGTGIFTDVSDQALPLRADIEETREVDLGDLDNDGDLDIHFSNVSFFSGTKNLFNRILLNDGHGFFTHAEQNLPSYTSHTVDALFADLDADDDLDLITAERVGGIREEPNGIQHRVFINDGKAIFSEQTLSWLPTSIHASGFDIEWFDANGDGKKDLYFSNFRGQDKLYIRRD